MQKWIKNADTVAHTWVSATIQPGAYHQIPTDKYALWASDDSLLTDIGAGLALVSRSDDGTTDMGISDGIDWLKDIDPTPRDTDGSPIHKQKTTQTGWHYEPRAIDFITSTYDSVYNRKHDGNGIDSGTDFGDATLSFYDVSGNILSYQQTGYETETEAQFQTRLDGACVKTFMDWQPTYEMDIIGGILVIADPPVLPNRAYMWCIIAPDIPENMGGSVPFISGGWALHWFANKDKIKADGRGVKRFIPDFVYNSNKIRMVLKHEVGAKIGMEIIYEQFKA